MRLRLAMKICLAVYGRRGKDIDKLVNSNWRWEQLKNARRVCRRHDRGVRRRVPYIPSDEEIADNQETRWCILENLGWALSGQPSIFDRKQ